MKMVKALVVDDSASSRVFCKTLLEALKCEVTESESAKEAIELYKENKTDIIVLDLNMPDMDGLQAAKEFISLDPYAKIIMITAVENKSIKYDLIAAGAKDYLEKPLDINKLEVAIKNAFK